MHVTGLVFLQDLQQYSESKLVLKLNLFHHNFITFLKLSKVSKSRARCVTATLTCAFSSIFATYSVSNSQLA